ncbi:MAG: biopolymer transporter ExbD [Pseudomonadota bacterium]
MEFARTTRKLRAISMVSLIDIVFTIILFFIVAGHMEKFSIIPVDLPSADSGQRLDEGPIVVMLGKYGEMLINDELFDPEQAASELKRQLAVNSARVITIKADAMLEANKLVDFMELIRAAGGKNLSLVTQSTTGAILQ